MAGIAKEVKAEILAKVRSGQKVVELFAMVTPRLLLLKD